MDSGRVPANRASSIRPRRGMQVLNLPPIGKTDGMCRITKEFGMGVKAYRLVALTLAAILLSLDGSSASALMMFSDSGANAASIQDTVDAFRLVLGDPNNGNAAGPLAA